MGDCIFQLFARITKLGWFDIQDKDYVFRNVISDVTKFIQVEFLHLKSLEQAETLGV